MRKTEKKALIICDRFPPDHGVGGTRIAYFVRSLAQHGWSFRVVTAFLPVDGPPMEVPGLPTDIPVDRFPFTEAERSRAGTFVDRIRDRWRRFRYPELAWWEPAIAPMETRAMEVCRDWKPDVILASTSTLYPVAIARNVGMRYGVPFVADFRDLTEQYSTEGLGLRSRLHRWRLIARRTEILRDAAVTVVVSEGYWKFIGECCRRELIYNGYDEDLFTPSSVSSFKQFVITYAGRVTDTRVRDPETFFQGLEGFLTSGLVDPEDVQVDFWGSEESVLAPFISTLTHPERVAVHPPVAYMEVPKLLAESVVLVLLAARGREGILYTKLFEYLAVNRPILVSPNDGSTLQDFFGGSRADGGDSTAGGGGSMEAAGIGSGAGTVCDSAGEVTEYLLNLYREWKETGTVAPPMEAGAFAVLSRQAQGERLVSVLEGL